MVNYDRKALRIASWVLTGLIAVFFANIGVNFILKSEQTRTSIADPLGIPYDLLPIIGVVNLVSLVLYLIPRTSRIGAVLKLGHLGGVAGATLVRSPTLSDGFVGFSFAILLGIVVCAPLWIRDSWMRRLFQGPQTPAALTRRTRLVGLVLTIGLGLFLLADVVIHVIKAPQAVETSAKLGIDETELVLVGVIEAVALAAFLWPRTSRLGVVLLTAYLGGACAVNLLAETPAFNVVFAPALGGVLWLTRYLADSWVRDALASPNAPAST